MSIEQIAQQTGIDVEVIRRVAQQHSSWYDQTIAVYKFAPPSIEERNHPCWGQPSQCQESAKWVGVAESPWSGFPVEQILSNPEIRYMV
jgi:hypothetical protein